MVVTAAGVAPARVPLMPAALQQQQLPQQQHAIHQQQPALQGAGAVEAAQQPGHALHSARRAPSPDPGVAAQAAAQAAAAAAAAAAMSAAANVATPPPQACGGGGAGDAAGIEKAMSAKGSTANSVGSTTEVTDGSEEQPLAPIGIVDVKRLHKIKQEQEARLNMLKARVARLAHQERRVWKDVQSTQQLSAKAQEAHWRRQAHAAERMRMEQDLLAQEQMLRERAREMRRHTMEAKDTPRLSKFEDNKRIGRQARDDSRRILNALQEVREQTLQSKAMQVEVRRQQQRQQKLRKELEATRKEQERQELNAMRFLELQEEINTAEQAIAAVEREELSAVDRLRNSQSVRAQMLSHMQESTAMPLTMPLAASPPPPVGRGSHSHGQLPGAPVGGHGIACAGPCQRRSSSLRSARGHSAGLYSLGQITEERNEEEEQRSSGQIAEQNLGQDVAAGLTAEGPIAAETAAAAGTAGRPQVLLTPWKPPRPGPRRSSSGGRPTASTSALFGYPAQVRAMGGTPPAATSASTQSLVSQVAHEPFVNGIGQDVEQQKNGRPVEAWS